MSKNDTIDQLNALFKTIQMESTLSPAAVVDYNKAIVQVTKSSEELELAQDKNEKLRKDLKIKDTELNDVKRDLSSWRKRDEHLSERENNMIKLELTSEYEQKRVQDHKDMFNIVFRNTEIHKKVLDTENTSYDENGVWVNRNVNKSYTETESKS